MPITPDTLYNRAPVSQLGYFDPNLNPEFVGKYALQVLDPLDDGSQSTFYWCYTPNSGDTGGILDDQLKVRADKMRLLRKLGGSAAVSDVRALAPDPLSVH